MAGRRPTPTFMTISTVVIANLVSVLCRECSDVWTGHAARTYLGECDNNILYEVHNAFVTLGIILRQSTAIQ